MQYPTLRLNPRADYRLRHGHLWIYSNEIDNKFSSIKNLVPGDLAAIESSVGKPLGLAYINPHTLICGRMLSGDVLQKIDLSWFMQRVQQALKLRNQLFSDACYRLVYGESDFLPGLVVDRYLDVLVVQVATAGMEKHLELIIAALDTVVQPKVILLKNDGKMREVEGLATYVEWKKGTPQSTALLSENGIKFIAPIEQGQKTGWFYDHRMTRNRIRDYVKDKRVLDMFSYIGGWGIQAAAFGAKEVVLCDASEFALQYVQENAALNNLTNTTTIVADAFATLDNLATAGEIFDVIILDPPAFVPRVKDLPKGTAAYQKLNLQAMRLLGANGILISGSCSMHLPATELQQVIHKAGLKLNRPVQILEQGHQGPDHPIHSAIPETGYLKAFIARVG